MLPCLNAWVYFGARHDLVCLCRLEMLPWASSAGVSGGVGLLRDSVSSPCHLWQTLGQEWMEMAVAQVAVSAPDSPYPPSSLWIHRIMGWFGLKGTLKMVRRGSHQAMGPTGDAGP